jgi:hypothetical protein
MKKLLFVITVLLFGQGLMAQENEKYMAAMKKNLAALETAFKEPAALLALANNFERIGDAEKNQWLPYYYAAFCQVNYGLMETDNSKKDPIAEKATLFINKADALNSNNSEISCIKSLIATCQMMVDPMQRYMKYGAASTQHLQTAKEQDKTNPRPELLIGQSLKYTPEQFGGGCGTAKGPITAALAKYENFKPASPIHPNWGKEMAVQIMNECK